MQFTFDSQNPTELRAVEAAVAVLVSGLAAPERLILEDVVSDDGATVIGSGTVETIRGDTLEAVTSINVIETTNLMSEDRTYQDAQTGAETDSAGQPWDPELHSSSRAKIADGTWKKKRGAKLADFSPLEKRVLEALQEPSDFGVGPTTGRLEVPQPEMQEFPKPPVPPVPPAPPATELVTMNQIWALITNNQATLNDVLAAAHRMGFADLGAVAQTATNEQRAALLKELTV